MQTQTHRNRWKGRFPVQNEPKNTRKKSRGGGGRGGGAGPKRGAFGNAMVILMPVFARVADVALLLKLSLPFSLAWLVVPPTGRMSTRLFHFELANSTRPR